MKKNVILTLVVLSMNILLRAQILCPNEVVNGNFEAGNTGFTSGLTSNCACVANTYCVNTNFNLKCADWPNLANHTSGGRNFLMVDGSTAAATNIWQTTVPSSPGTTYTFSFWVASVYPSNQQVFDLGLVVNGSVVRQFTISQATPTWTQYSFSGVCPPNLRSIPIAIRQMSGGAFRDFGIDDVYFACCECKANYETTNLDNCRNFQFKNTSTGAGVTYSWDFGDPASGVNNTSSLANPTHLFSKCGKFEVCLTLKGEGCSSKICYSVDATDNIPPVIACPRNLTVNTNPGQCYYTGTLPEPSYTDNCSKKPEFIYSLLTPTSSILITPQTQFPKGVNTISCIARDECGNTSRSCTFTLTVRDNQAPVITCPISISVVGAKDAQGRCKALLSGFAPTVTDNCPMVTLTYAITGATTATGSNNVTEVNFMEGVSTVTYTAVDMDGNRATCSFTVTVRCPCEAGFTFANLNNCSNVQFTNTSTGTVPVTYAWSFGDPDSGTANTSTLQNPSHQFSKCGTYEVCLTITGNGCSSKVCKSVTVTDKELPKITCPPNVTVSTNPGQCYFSGKLVEPKATDNCDKELEIICRIFAPNRPITITPQTQFAKGEHLITCFAVDDCGNVSETCTYTLTVVDRELPIITCPANISVQGTLNAEGLCKAVVKNLAPKASDNCPMLGVNWRLSGATIGQGVADASGTNFMQGVTTVTYTAVDMAGNSATCSFTVTVECKPNGFPCDSLEVSYSVSTPPGEKKCCYAIDLTNQVKTQGLNKICANLNTPGWIFNTGALLAAGWVWDQVGTNQLCFKPQNGNIPVAQLQDVLTFCLAAISPNAPTKQQVVFEWYAGEKIVCKDTIRTECSSITSQDTCVVISNLQVKCLGEDDFEYCMTFDATNLNNTDVYGLILGSLPPGFSYANCGCGGSAYGSGGYLFSDFPLIPANSTKTFCVKVIAASPVLSPTKICFNTTLEFGVKCCSSPKDWCVELKPCCDPCEETLVTVKESNSDSCCYSLDFKFNCDFKPFTHIDFDILTPGVSFGWHTNDLSWGMHTMPTLTSVHIKPDVGTVPLGTIKDLFSFCLKDLNQPSANPQQVKITYWTTGSNGKDSMACDTILNFNCEYKKDTCLFVTNEKIRCIPDSMKYEITVTVQNLSVPNFTASYLGILGPGITPNPVLLSPSLGYGDSRTVTFCYMPTTWPDPDGKLIITYRLKHAQSDSCCNGGQVLMDTLMLPPCDTCLCGSFSDLTFRPARGAPNMPIKCGDTLNVSCNPQFDPIIAGNFQCVGECAVAPVHWELVSLTPNSMFVASGNVSGGNFSIALLAAYFSTPGTYELTLVGQCGGKSCPPCKFIIKATGCPCCEDFDVFCQSIMNHIEIKVDSAKCKATLAVCNIRECDYIQSINWGDSTTSTGPFTAGAMPMHTYTGSGTYVISYVAVEVNPLTGKICFEKEFRDTITLNCDSICRCGGFSELSFRPAKGAPNMPVKCGDTIGVSCNPTFDPIISGNFKCVGECATAPVHWELVSLTPNSMFVASGDVSGGNFSLTLLAAYFSTPGTYELTLSSKCGKQSCPPCKFIIKATGCPCCEDYDVFCQSIMNHIEIKLDPAKCKVSLTVCNIRECDYLESISWGDGSNSAGPFGPGDMSMHTYTGSGTYIISYLAIEKDPITGKICFEKRLYDTITIVCKDCACKGADDLEFGGFQGASGFGATCGSLTPIELPCSTAGALFYFHGNVYCDGDSCLGNQIGWSIGEGNIKVISGTMPISHIFPGGNKGHFDLTNLDPAMFAPGVVYTLTIGWNCGGKPCSCTVRFVFKKCPDCACGKFTDIFLRPNSGPSIPLSCGDKGPLVPCPIVGQPFNITGSFACQGDDCPKTTLINWTLLNPSGTPVATGSVTTSPPIFSINLPPALFSVKGEYTLKLEGHCGNKLCTCLIKFRFEAPCPSDDCVCGTYSEMFIRSGRGPSIPVTCGGNAVPIGCPPNGQGLVLTGQFGCQGEKCPKTTLMDWVLIGPSGPITSGNGVLASPSFSISISPALLTQAGVYTLRLIGHCGKLECPCEIKFMMDPPCSNDFCECGNFTNMTFRPAKGAPNMSVKCEDTLNLACDPNFNPVISGNFQCVGKNCPIAPMHWELRALPSYTLVAMGDESLTPGFSVTLLAAYFSTPGMYELAFTGDCGNTQSCAPCKFIINAKGCPCCEDYDLFVQSVEQAVTLSVDNLNCKATLSVGNLRKCDVIQQIDWGDGNQSIGPFTTGAMEMHFYTGKGPYIVSWLALERNAAGKVCFEKVFRDTITLNCDSSCTCSNYDLSVKIGKANLQVHCGDTIDVPGSFGFYGEFGCVGTGCPESAGVYMAWTLSGPPGFIEESGHVIVRSDIFIPSLNPANLTIPGLYTLTLGAYCGADSCPCTLYFLVSDYCCKDSSVFLQNAKIVQTFGTLGDCTLSFQATGLTACMRIWYDWGDGTFTGPITVNNVPITHTYAAAGKYVVCYTIEEIKNGLVCQRYTHCDTIEVKCRCGCGTFEQVKLVNKNLGTSRALLCDSKVLLELPCPPVGKPYMVTGKLVCNPTDCKGTNLRWELKDGTGKVVASGNQTGPWFSVPLDYNLLSKLTGDYTLVLTGMCGSKTCSCTYYFRFLACPETCPCDDAFTQSVQAGFNWWWAGSGYCAYAFSPKGILDCDKVSWTISGVDIATNTIMSFSGTSLNNQTFTQVFPGGIIGDFLVTMIVSRIGPDGKPCERKFNQTVRINCIGLGTGFMCNDNIIVNPGFDQNSMPGILGETGKTSAWVRQAGTPTLVDQAGIADRYSIVLAGKCFGVIDVISNPVVLGPKRVGRVNFAYKASVDDLRPGTHLVLRLSDAPQTGMTCTDRCVEIARMPINATDGKWGNISTTFSLNSLEGRKLLSLHVENDLAYEDPDANSKVFIDNLCFTQLESLTTETRDLLNNRLTVRIFPNPNPGNFTVELPQPATSGMTLRVTDLAGRLVLEKSTETGNLQQTIQAEYLSNGMYFLQVIEKGRIVGVEKFVKQ